MVRLCHHTQLLLWIPAIHQKLSSPSCARHTHCYLYTSCHITLRDPYYLWATIKLYHHKIFVRAMLWRFTNVKIQYMWHDLPYISCLHLFLFSTAVVIVISVKTLLLKNELLYFNLAFKLVKSTHRMAQTYFYQGVSENHIQRNIQNTSIECDVHFFFFRLLICSIETTRQIYKARRLLGRLEDKFIVYKQIGSSCALLANSEVAQLIMVASIQPIIYLN